jgi:hypothetical protein
MAFYIVLNIDNFINIKHLDYKLNTLDLDGDEIFSIEEQTPEQKEMMRRVTNDLGRNLFPIISGIHSILNIFILIISTKIMDIFIKDKNSKMGR